MEPLFAPRSITVLGASDDSAKWGHTLSRRALESSGGRPVLLVNGRGAEVLGRPTHRSLAEARIACGAALDLVVVCVPASGLVPAVRDAVAAGARALVVISAGLSELGSAGAEAEREATGLCRAAGVVLVGPNCLGVVDTSTELQLSHDLMPRGGVTVLSQSGNLVLDLSSLLERRGLGVSRFVSLGNQADLSVVELMWSCLAHEATRAVAIYAEDLVDGRGFIAAARALAAAGKPVVMLAPGRSVAAVRSALSHTGSLTSASRVIDAACAAAGIHRVDNPTEMANLLEGLAGGRRMPGRRVAVLTDGGGHGAVAADALSTVGLETPLLAAGTVATLREQLWHYSTLTNPVDLAGAGEDEPMRYAWTLGTLLAADDTDGVLVTGYFGGYSTGSTTTAAREIEAARAIADLVTAQQKPVVVQTIFPDGPTGRLLQQAGVPVHRDVDRAAAVLAGLAPAVLTSEDDLSLPPAEAPVTDTSYDAARALFTRAGIEFPASCTVRDAAELDAVLARVDDGARPRPPLVLKALGAVHKSEAGGVVLGLGDLEEVRAAYADLVTRLAPPAVSVEEMADTAAGVEVIVGCVRDPRFGPVLMVGLGGVFTEVLDDTVFAIAPVSAHSARQLLLSLQAAPLLLGARGSDPVDVDSLADTVSRFSRVAAAHLELVELELNPVLAGVAGTTALDARIVLGQG